MGAALESLVDKGVRVPTTIRWQQQTPLKTLFLCSLYDFKNLKSSSTWFNPCFPLRRAYLLLYVESVYLLLSILEANTCVNCVHWFLHACLLHLLYYFVLTIIHEICMLKVESNCWNLNPPLCCFKTFYLESIALWVNSYARLFDTCLESTIHEKFCYMIQLFSHYLFC